MSEAQTENERAWYVVHTYSGYENKVKANLEKRVSSMGMQDKIFQVLVPSEEQVEVKDGKRRTVRRKIFPSYVLVEMIMSDDSWYVVRNTPGVTGFVGSGNKATPLLPSEAAEIITASTGETEAKPHIELVQGDRVQVNLGPFAGFVGVVQEVQSSGKIKVLLSMFGRETPVELDFTQVEKN